MQRYHASYKLYIKSHKASGINGSHKHDHTTVDHFSKHNPQRRFVLLFPSFSVTQIENKTIIYVGTAFIQRFYRDAKRILNRHIFMYHCLQLRVFATQEPLGNQLPLCNGSSLIPVCHLPPKKNKFGKFLDGARLHYWV